MKILMTASEATPLAKSGGLADAVASLSAALLKAGHDVRIVMPRYYSMDRSALRSLGEPLGVPLGSGEFWCAVYETSLPGTKVPVYLLDHEGLYGRDGIYGTKAETDFRDNALRFAFLSRAAFQLCRALSWVPDLFHAHDWPTGLVPLYLRQAEAHGDFAKSASVFTIHNLGYQGVYGAEWASVAGLSMGALEAGGLFAASSFSPKGSINLLKAGLQSADALTTVSPTYAREIQTPQAGCGLDGLLSGRAADLKGILNGIDEDEWNPAKDKLIPATFGAKTIGDKAKDKKALQERFGLPVDGAKPLIGMITRLTSQKGVGELFGPGHGSAWGIATEMDLQMVLLGSGEDWCEREVSALASRLPNFKAQIGYDNSLAHLIEAGADFFLMPSLYEPCGLNQMYSLRYGTLPIARRTGGLADTIESYNEATGAGTGFLFEDLTPQAIKDTVGWAVWAWYNRPDHIEAMRRRAMAQDFSWKRSAKAYEAVYEKALSKKRD
jgi:starch synthase